MISPRNDKISQIHEAGIQEALENFHLPFRFMETILRPIINSPLKRLANLIDEYDQRIDLYGLDIATQWFVNHFVSSLTLKGLENIPEEGPLLITPNHAGGIDFLTIMAAMKRKDFRVIANEHAIISPTTFLPDYLLSIGDDPDDRSAIIFSVLEALKTGHAVLVFPAGLLEPDPKIIPGAQEHLDTWSPSLGIFVKKVPNLKILPAVIGGTISPDIYNSFVPKRRSTVKKRAKTTLLIQYLNQLARPGKTKMDIEVVFGEPIDCSQLPAKEHPEVILKTIVERQKELMHRIYPHSNQALENWYEID